jgi:hypothetical protein
MKIFQNATEIAGTSLASRECPASLGGSSLTNAEDVQILPHESDL